MVYSEACTPGVAVSFRGSRIYASSHPWGVFPPEEGFFPADLKSATVAKKYVPHFQRFSFGLVSASCQLQVAWFGVSGLQ